MWLRTTGTTAHVLGAATVLLVLSLAGCSGGGDDDGRDAAPDPTATAAPSPSTAASATPTIVPVTTPVSEATTPTTAAATTTAPSTTAPPTTTAPAATIATASDVDAAVARFVEFMHAYGNGDLATYCDIALPGLTKYFGPMTNEDCVGVMGDSMTESAADLASIAEATVDATQAVAAAPDRVEIPATAIAYPAPIDDPGEPGDLAIMGLIDGEWYVVDGV